MAEFATDKPIVFEPYATNRELGGFILIDKFTNATVAAGMIDFSLRRADNVHWQPTAITREDHAGLKNQTPSACCGSPACRAAAMSTIANEVEKALNLMNRHTFLLDG